MSKNYDITFSVGMHDSDGDCYDNGIFLRMDRGDFIVRVANGEDLDSLITSLVRCRNELLETGQAAFGSASKMEVRVA